MTRRGFLGWFIGTILLVVGCMPRKAEQPSTPASSPTPQTAPPPPQIPTPSPPPKQPIPTQGIVFAARDETSAADAIAGNGINQVSDMVGGKRGEVPIVLPPSEGVQNLTFEFRGEPAISPQKHLVVSAPGAGQLHSVFDRGSFLFKNEKGQTLMDVSGATPRPLRFGPDQIREGFKNPEKLRGLMRVGTRVLAIAIFVWLGAKIAIVLLAGIAFLAFLGILLGLLAVTAGPALKAFKALLKEAGISDEQVEHFLVQTKNVAREVLREALSELRNIPKLANP